MIDQLEHTARDHGLILNARPDGEFVRVFIAKPDSEALIPQSQSCSFTFTKEQIVELSPKQVLALVLGEWERVLDEGIAEQTRVKGLVKELRKGVRLLDKLGVIEIDRGM